MMAAWADLDEKQDIKSYKFIHHRNEPSHPLVYEGLVKAMSQLQTQTLAIPDADRQAVYDHLAKHFREFGRTPPPFRAKAEKFNLAEFKKGKVKSRDPIPVHKPIKIKTINSKSPIKSKTIIDEKQILEDARESFEVNVLGKV